ncbi:MAG: DUF58 domain-containing protein [Chlamydiales bacterium]|nr:DUF58 domain-containing protein [Chlamydiales bacterium]
MSEIPLDVLRKIKKVQIKASKMVSDALSGAYVSSFKGAGIIFDDVREYDIGDEVRNIDWNLTAKMQTPFVKLYQEERELTVYFLVDVSSSMLFGSNSKNKFDILIELLAALAFSAVSNNDKIGLVLFDNKVCKYLPPRRGVAHFLRMIREVYVHKDRGKESSVVEALNFFSRVQKKSCICFLLSDFLFDLDIKGLSALSKKHDISAINISDPAEKLIPDMGITKLTDLETGRSVYVDSSQAEFKEWFADYEDEKGKELTKLFKKLNMPYLEASSDSDILRALSLFLNKKKAV